MRNHQIECTEPLFQLFRGEGILGPNQLNISPLGSGTIKILLFRGIQPYLQQRSPLLLRHHDGTQDHPTEKRDDPEMGSQCKRQV